MLSLANVSAAHGATYYKVENYYSQKDSVGFSKWVGLDAKKLGLEGPVEHPRFSALLKGTDAKVQVAGSAENRRRAGLDMTFSAPKSVSLQALVFGDTRLIHAHREAVLEALAYAERNFAAYRVGGRNDRSVVKPGRFLVAQFEHDSSRLKDPQLHTHNVVLNRMQSANGKIRALHGDLFYKNSVLLGMIYQNSLAKKAQNLGYAIQPNVAGTFELAGFSKENLAVFSKRKEQLKALAPTSYRESRELVLQDRKAKSGPQQREQLVQAWQKEASHNGVLDAKSPVKKIQKIKNSFQLLEKTMQEALSSVSTKSSVFRKEDALRESLHLSLGQFDIAEHEKSFKKSQNSSVLQTQKSEYFTTRAAVERDLDSRDLVSTGIGNYEPITNAEVAFQKIQALQNLNTESAKKAVLKLEVGLQQNGLDTKSTAKIIDSLNQAVSSNLRVPLSVLTQMRQDLISELRVLSPKAKNIEKSAAEILKPIQKEFLAPTQGQRDAIAQTLVSKDKVILWQGVAGAGKTTAMRQIVEVATEAGYRVSGFAPSATAAIQLSQETGIETATVQSHILKRESAVPEKSLWIVDEAGMISAKDFYALQLKAQTQNARVLLVGDSRQLSPVDAGNPFLDIQKNTQTTVITLDQSLRQKSPLLQAAADKMNRGDVAGGVKILEQNIEEWVTEKGRQSFIAREYLKKPQSTQKEALLLTRTNRERQDLTAKIRTGLKEQGFLTQEILVPVLLKIDFLPSRLRISTSYTEGDVLVPNRTYQKLGLQKDHRYEVVQVHAQKNEVTVQYLNKEVGTKIAIPVSRHSQFSLFSKKELPVAEGDKMIWNRNIKSRGELNNGGFVVERVAQNGIFIRLDSGQTKILNPKDAHHIEHAWALTLYKAQGKTTSDVLQLVNAGTSKRDLLVGVTRAENSVLLVAKSREGVLQSAEHGSHKAIAAEEVGAAVVEKIQIESKQGINVRR